MPNFILVGVLLMLFLIASTGAATTTVLAVDVSAAMGETCPGTEETSLQIVRKALTDYLRNEDRSNRGDAIGLVVFGQGSTIVSEPVSDPLRLLVLAEGLKVQGGDAALTEGLNLARSLLPPQGGRMIVYTRSAHELGLLQALTHTIDGAVQTEVNLVAGSSSGGQASGALRLQMLACGEPEGQTETEKRVREIVGAALGAPLGLITAQTDLVDDLGADHSLAFEALSMVCGQLGIPMPPDADLTRVGDIIAYAERAASGKAAVAEGGLRGGVKAVGAPPKPVLVQTLFYATDRRKTGKSDPYKFYGVARGEGPSLQYGRCEVSIPVLDHRPGHLETPLLELEFLRDPKKHIILKSVHPLERNAFFRAVREGLRPQAAGAEWGDDILLFVHGYNVRFDQAARRTAQIAYDIGFDGVPMMFSWPSSGRLTAYLTDRENIEWSVTHIEHFLDELLRQVHPGRVHLIAHSMGNEGLLRALGFLALRHSSEGEPLFDNVILAAPDFDARIFVEQYAPRIKHLARRWTIYASDKDQALNLSTSLRNARRLGVPIAVAEGIDTIDATGVEVTPWSVPEFHSYYATKKRVMRDLISVLKGLEPKRRDLLRSMTDGGVYWSLNLPGVP